jgi:hypothetical protein
MNHINIIFLIFNLLAWGLVIYLAYRMYRKQQEPIRLWKVAIVIVVGLFSFSFQFDVANTPVKFPIIPLGVFILFIVFSGSETKWQAYRTYAWLGFGANFIFLAAMLLAIPLHALIYPKDEPSTYLARAERADVIPVHPSAKDLKLNVEKLMKQMNTLERNKIMNTQWYEETYTKEPHEREERFPYQLMGTRPKWGSGLESIIYIEQDGQGLLIVTPHETYYFRAQAPFLERGAKNE